MRSLCCGCLACIVIGCAADLEAAQHRASERATVKEGEPEVISPCAGRQYLSIMALREYCGLDIRCGSPMPCDGKIACVTGEVDRANIWERAQHPSLPAEKFFLRDPGDGAMLEILLAFPDTTSAFRKLRSAAEASQAVFLRGRIEGFDTPTMVTCRRDIALVLDDEAAIQLADQFDEAR
jgi:hypothetical protein